MRRSRSIALATFGGFLTLLLLALVAGVLWLASPGGRDFVLRTGTDAAQDAGLALALDGVEGSLLGKLTIAHVAIDDSGGRWLEARNLTVAWHPWRLLRGRLHIGELSAESIDVSRAPILPPAPDADTSGGGFSLPLPIELDRLAVTRLVLGEELVGRTVAASIESHAMARRDQGQMGLRVRRLDAPGTIDLEAGFDVPRNALAVALEIDEPPGGLIASLAGLEGEPAVHVDLTGDGPLSRWRGRLRATIDEAPLATLGVAVDGETTRSIAIGGRVALHSFAARLPEDVAALLGPEIGVASEFVLDGEQWRATRIAVETAAADLTASGSYRRDTGRFAGEARLSRLSREAAERYGVTLDDPEISATARGDGGRMDITLRLDAGRIGVQGAAVEGLQTRLQAARANERAAWSLTVAGDGEVTSLPGEPTPATAKLLGPLSLAARGTVGSTAASLEDFRFTLGPLALAAAGQYRAPRADGTLSLEISDLTGLLPGAASAPPAGARFATAVRYAEDEGLALDDMTLDLPGGEITGAASLDAAFERIDASFKSAGVDLGAITRLINVPLAGRLALNATVTGALGDPSVQARASLHDGSFDGNALPRAELSAGVTTAVTAPQGEIALVAHPPQGATSLSTRFALRNDETLDLRAIRIDGPGVSGEGQVALALDHGLATGQIRLDAADLAPLLESAGLSGSGAVKLRLSLSAADNRQQAEVSGEARSIVVARGGDELLSVGRATVSAKGATTPKAPLTAKLNAEAISAGGAVVRQLSLDARGTAELVTFDLRLAAPAYRDVQLALGGSLRTEGELRTVRLTRGSGSVMGQAFAVEPGMTATIAPNGYRVSGFRISGRGLGQITADASLQEGVIAGKLTARGIPLALLNSGEERGFLGQVDLLASVDGTVERPRGQATLSARDLTMAGDRAGNKAAARIELTVDDKAAALQASVTGLSAAPLAANARIGRSPNGLGFGDTSALSGQLVWRGDIREITRFAPLVGQQVSGDMAADLAFAGTLGRPGVSGTVAVRDAVVEDYVSGLVLRFPRLDIAGDNNRIVLQPFEASDPAGGTLSGTARVNLDPAGGFPFDARLNFVKARLLHRDDLMAIVSGTVTASGSVDKAQVRGDLRTEHVEVNLDTGLPPSIVTVEATEIPARLDHGDIKAPAADRAASAAGGEVLLDINLAMPGRVFVRGRGLDSEWEGNIAVTGSAAKPRVSGKLSSRRGQFDIIERLFKLQPSVIDLAPSADGSIDALLAIKAVHEANDLAVTLAVSGTATKPKIELSSVPALPQDEILSRLLFNKARASLSPLEALQLARSLRTLSGGGGGLDPIASLRRAMGVDVLRVDTSDMDSGPALEAGKYITDKVYVGVRQGAEPGSSGVAVEIDIFENLSVGNEIRQDGSNRLGLKYKWDY